MKRHGVLNSEICAVVSTMGHLDRIAIGDAGLPIPQGVRRIDLALTPGVPPFLDTLAALLGELTVESALLAAEMRETSGGLFARTLDTLQCIPCREIPHERLKQELVHCRAVIRTGEYTPYANIVLISGVNF